MKTILSLIFISGFYFLQAQNLSGQWRGTFDSFGDIVTEGGRTEGNTEYVLEINVNGSSVDGYSYSYFKYPDQTYFVICRLEGAYDKASKSIEVKEVERVKGNTPSFWGDCLQTHYLTYLKQGAGEQLVGRWRGTTPDNCGYGSTALSRKALVRVTPKNTKPIPANTTAAKPKPGNATAKTSTPKKPTPPIAKKEPARTFNTKPQLLTENTRVLPPIKSETNISGVHKRKKEVLKTIDIATTDVFKVDFYDNGEIDGDTISVYYNNNLILDKQRLTDKPLSINIKLDTTIEVNELIMYAENLGTIPPNTALMVLTVGGKRYSVHITSTENTSGTIRFRRKK